MPDQHGIIAALFNIGCDDLLSCLWVLSYRLETIRSLPMFLRSTLQVQR